MALRRRQSSENSLLPAPAPRWEGIILASNWPQLIIYVTTKNYSTTVNYQKIIVLGANEVVFEHFVSINVRTL